MQLLKTNTILYPKRKSNGFTLVELIVVIGVIAVLTTVFLINFSSQKGPRNLRISTAELNTNLRKIQSYTLSSRDTATGVPAAYYLMSLNTLSGANTKYTSSLIDNNSAISTTETVVLPTDVTINSISITAADGTTVAGPIECVQIAFKLPFAVTYIDYDNNGNGTCDVNFLSDQNNPVTLASMINRKITITLKERVSGQTTTVVVNGVSGVISQP